MIRRAAALLALLLLVAACSDVEGTGDLTYVAGDGQVIQVAPGDREDPVEISGTTVQGEPLDVADLRGRVVVLNVWWSGCGPCRTEMPMLVEADEETDADDVAFVGINIRDLARENAASFERDRGVGYPSLYDQGSETLLRMGRFTPHATPATVLLDRQGRVAAMINGPIPSKSTLTTLIDELVAESDG
ncbi:TlpA disulfide reductase family protein [Nocardioides sp. SYSU DS0651]|uniref:TlpA disulfide reductase family protein n=1 Tax=Nocardioides sp. SYSU DS0651 TaxID=3415955 RepID=UPI003F4BD7A3